jgi:CheY-like chemotaxis protein
MQKRILILDSSSVLAIRLKVLLELLTCDVELMHYSDFDANDELVYYEAIMFASGVPQKLVTQVKQLFGEINYFLLAPNTNGKKMPAGFSKLIQALPKALVIFPYYDNKKVSAILEEGLAIGTENLAIKLPKILLVDDNKERLKELEASLKGAHIEVICAETSDAAIGRAALYQIDLLVSDFNMTETTGIIFFVKLSL